MVAEGEDKAETEEKAADLVHHQELLRECILQDSNKCKDEIKRATKSKIILIYFHELHFGTPLEILKSSS